MPLIQIRNHVNQNIIYEGVHKTAKECVQSAVDNNVKLDYADLQYCNLSGITLDGGRFANTLFNFTNLNGANMSEAVFDHSHFIGATLADSCLCESHFKHADFTAALFGATDILESIFDGASFGTTSSLLLNFKDAKSLENCHFKSGDIIMPFSRPPIVITGMDFPVTFLDHHMGIGNIYKTYKQWFCAPNDNTPEAKHDLAYKYRFLNMNNKALNAIAKNHTRQHHATIKTIQKQADRANI